MSKLKMGMKTSLKLLLKHHTLLCKFSEEETQLYYLQRSTEVGKNRKSNTEASVFFTEPNLTLNRFLILEIKINFWAFKIDLKSYTLWRILNGPSPFLLSKETFLL